MSFGDAIKSFFNNYANFKGRARRSEYWYALLFTFLVNLPLSVFGDAGPDGTDANLFTALSLLWSLAVLIPSIAIAVRRLHDTGRRGTYLWFLLIPIVGAILVFIRLVEDSQPVANQFGQTVK
jgi:uncharacterized membrane protein YhaH (DUF805 family)